MLQKCLQDSGSKVGGVWLYGFRLQDVGFQVGSRQLGGCRPSMREKLSS